MAAAMAAKAAAVGWMPHWKTGCWMRRCGKWRRAHGRDSAAGLRDALFSLALERNQLKVWRREAEAVARF